jgi:hypothetical protein
MMNHDKNIDTSLLLIFSLLSLGAVIFIMASVPPFIRDELTHHLAVPKLYIKHGGICELPNIKFSYYPMNIDLLYLIPLYFNNDIAPKYIHFLFALLTAVFIYHYLRKQTSREYGLLGALFFLSTPVIVRLSTTAYVDLGLVFFSWLCLFYFLKWCSEDYKLRYLIYAGAICGMALGSKYNGLLTLFIMAGLTPLAYSIPVNSKMTTIDHNQRNRNSIRGLGYGALFIIAALIVFSPWMIRNYIWTQNPVYPLYESVFNADNTALGISDIEKPTKFNHFQRRRYIYHESFWESAFMPVRIFFQGKDDDPKYFDGKLNPFLIILPIFAFWKRKTRNRKLDLHKNILLAFTVLFLMIALFTTDMRIRYISPVIPPLVILSMLGINNCLTVLSDASWGKQFFRILMISIITFAFCLNGTYVAQLFQTIDPIDYILNKVDRDAYISRFVGEYPTLQYANQHLQEDARVLCLLLGNRTYYLDREFVLNENFFRKNSAGRYSEDALIKRLNQSRATHIILGLLTYKNWAKSSLNPHEEMVFRNFFNKHTKTRYEKNGYLLLEVIH